MGAVASMVIGFSWGGWMTGGTAIKLADDQANTAVVAALTPICVQKFLQNNDAKGSLAVLQKISTNWEQGDYLQKGGWGSTVDWLGCCLQAMRRQRSPRAAPASDSVSGG
jgi:alpha/beta superfamily hydrolase